MFPPLLIPTLSRIWVSSVNVQAGLCKTWSETPKTGFLASRLIKLISTGDRVMYMRSSLR